MPATAEKATSNQIPTLPVLPTVGERKLYRLVVLEGAPFYHATVGGQQFHDYSKRFIQTGEGKNGEKIGRSIDERGLLVLLTDGEAEAIKADMPRVYVRWQNRGQMLAKIIRPHGKEGPEDKREIVPIDPSTDENIAKYIAIEAA